MNQLTDAATESEIKAKGLTAPRVTPHQIDALMAGVKVKTHHFPGTTTMVAVAFSADGFSVGVGTSACASPENFDAELGAKIATANALKEARQKFWELEGYVLKKQLGGQK